MLSLLFILLLIFIINSSTVVFPATLVETNLELPTIETARIQVLDKSILSIAKDGRLSFNYRDLDGLPDLERELAERARDGRRATANLLNQPENNTPELSPMLVIRADKHASYETVAKAMDFARKAGMQVYLASEPPPAAMDDVDKPVPQLSQP